MRAIASAPMVRRFRIGGAEMTPTRLKKGAQGYFAGQWAEAGVYRCLDPCPLGPREVVLLEDGFLPDPTGGWVGRFVRVRKRRRGFPAGACNQSYSDLDI